jgi:hypothetical protein
LARIKVIWSIEYFLSVSNSNKQHLNEILVGAKIRASNLQYFMQQLYKLSYAASLSGAFFICTLLRLQMVVTELLHNYRRVITQSINPRPSTVPKLPCSLSSLIIFRFFFQCDEPAGPLKSGMLLFVLVDWRCMVFCIMNIWFMIIDLLSQITIIK